MSTRHELTRGARWHLARPRSRALWTSASDREVHELLTSARLRAELDELLRRAASAVDDIESLLVFDQQCVDLLVVISLRDTQCRWEWVARSGAA